MLLYMGNIDKVFLIIQEHKWSFLAAFFAFFTISYAILVVVDFIPEPITDENADEASFMESAIALEPVADFDPFRDTIEFDEAGEAKIVKVGEETVSLTIPSLNRTVRTITPASSSLADLDTALLSGVVRHPDSAKLGEEGNVVILGHSSYLPNVFNRNFQALNGTQDLEWGDTITVDSLTMRHTYMVKNVYKVKASEAVIPTVGVGQRLTLVTCNSFATADDRFIIEADWLSSEPV